MKLEEAIAACKDPIELAILEIMTSSVSAICTYKRRLEWAQEIALLVEKLPEKRLLDQQGEIEILRAEVELVREQNKQLTTKGADRVYDAEIKWQRALAFLIEMRRLCGGVMSNLGREERFASLWKTVRTEGKEDK